MSGDRRKRTHTSACAQHQVSRELKKKQRARPQLSSSLRMCAQKAVPIFHYVLLARASIHYGSAAFLKRLQPRKEPSCAWTINFVLLASRVIANSENALKPENVPRLIVTHNKLLHGAEWVFPPREQEQRVANANSLATKTSIQNTPKTATEEKTVSKVSTFYAFLSAHKGLLPVIELEVSFNSTKKEALVLCDSACSNSCMFSSLAKRFILEE